MYLIGYMAAFKNYRLYNPDSNKIVISCDVVFNEKAKVDDVLDFDSKLITSVSFPDDSLRKVEMRLITEESESETIQQIPAEEQRSANTEQQQPINVGEQRLAYNLRRNRIIVANTLQR